MRGTRLAAGLISFVALSADAGMTYRFTTQSTTRLGSSSSGGQVWIDGDRKRIELDADPTNPRVFDVAISADGKTTFLNLANKTYFHDSKFAGRALMMGSGSMLFRMPIPNARVKGHPKVSYRNSGEGPAFREHSTTRHVIQLGYRMTGEIQGMSVQGDVESTVSVVTAPALPRDPALVPVRTGIPQIDEALTPHVASITGMIVRRELSVSRKLEGGPVITETTTTTLDEIKLSDFDKKMFLIPPGFTFQEPVLGIPGR